MSEIKSITAEFTLHVDAECPYCEHDFNLFDVDKLNNGHQLIKLLTPDGHWSDAGKNYNREVICPECKKVILITDIYY